MGRGRLRFTLFVVAVLLFGIQWVGAVVEYDWVYRCAPNYYPSQCHNDPSIEKCYQTAQHVGTCPSEFSCEESGLLAYCVKIGFGCLNDNHCPDENRACDIETNSCVWTNIEDPIMAEDEDEDGLFNCEDPDVVDIICDDKLQEHFGEEFGTVSCSDGLCQYPEVFVIDVKPRLNIDGCPSDYLSMNNNHDGGDYGNKWWKTCVKFITKDELFLTPHTEVVVDSVIKLPYTACPEGYEASSDIRVNGGDNDDYCTAPLAFCNKKTYFDELDFDGYSEDNDEYPVINVVSTYGTTDFNPDGYTNWFKTSEKRGVHDDSHGYCNVWWRQWVQRVPPESYDGDTLQELCDELDADWLEDSEGNNLCCGDDANDWGYVSQDKTMLCLERDLSWVNVLEYNNYQILYQEHNLPVFDPPYWDAYISNTNTWWVCDANGRYEDEITNADRIEEGGTFELAPFQPAEGYQCTEVAHEYFLALPDGWDYPFQFQENADDLRGYCYNEEYQTSYADCACNFPEGYPGPAFMQFENFEDVLSPPESSGSGGLGCGQTGLIICSTPEDCFCEEISESANVECEDYEDDYDFTFTACQEGQLCYDGDVNVDMLISAESANPPLCCYGINPECYFPEDPELPDQVEELCIIDPLVCDEDSECCTADQYCVGNSENGCCDGYCEDLASQFELGRRIGAFTCYYEGEKNNIRECCGTGEDCFNYDSHYKFSTAGGTIHTLSNFDEMGDSHNYHEDWKYRITDLSRGIFVDKGFTITPLFNSKMDWRGFESLEFDYMHSHKYDPPIRDVYLEWEDDDGDTRLYYLGEFSSFTLGDHGARWNHAVIPLQDVDDDILERAETLRFFPNPDIAGAQIVFDDFILRESADDSDAYNSVDQYCAGQWNMWLPDLDPVPGIEPKAFKFACDSREAYSWTGTQCCGDDMHFEPCTWNSCSDGYECMDGFCVRDLGDQEQIIEEEFDSINGWELVKRTSSPDPDTFEIYNEHVIPGDWELLYVTGVNRESAHSEEEMLVDFLNEPEWMPCCGEINYDMFGRLSLSDKNIFLYDDRNGDNEFDNLSVVLQFYGKVEEHKHLEFFGKVNDMLNITVVDIDDNIIITYVHDNRGKNFANSGFYNTAWLPEEGWYKFIFSYAGLGYDSDTGMGDMLNITIGLVEEYTESLDDIFSSMTATDYYIDDPEIENNMLKFEVPEDGAYQPNSAGYKTKYYARKEWDADFSDIKYTYLHFGMIGDLVENRHWLYDPWNGGAYWRDDVSHNFMKYELHYLDDDGNIIANHSGSVGNVHIDEVPDHVTNLLDYTHRHFYNQDLHDVDKVELQLYLGMYDHVAPADEEWKRVEGTLFIDDIGIELHNTEYEYSSENMVGESYNDEKGGCFNSMTVEPNIPIWETANNEDYYPNIIYAKDDDFTGFKQCGVARQQINILIDKPITYDGVTEEGQLVTQWSGLCELHGNYYCSPYATYVHIDDTEPFPLIDSTWMEIQGDTDQMMMCIDGETVDVYEKWDWLNNEWGYCPQEMCYCNPEFEECDEFEDKLGACVRDGNYYLDNLCAGGAWTSRTAFAAAYLHDSSIGTDYVLHCEDNPKIINNDLFEITRYTDNHMLPERRLINGACVLRIPGNNPQDNDNNNHNTIYATSFNEHIINNMTSPEYFIAELNNYVSVYVDVEEDDWLDGSECNNALETLEMTECDGITGDMQDYIKLYYDPVLQILLVSYNDVPEYTDYNIFEIIWDGLSEIWSDPLETGNPDILPTSFSKLYVNVHGDEKVIARQEYIWNEDLNSSQDVLDLGLYEINSADYNYFRSIGEHRIEGSEEDHYHFIFVDPNANWTSFMKPIRLN